MKKVIYICDICDKEFAATIWSRHQPAPLEHNYPIPNSDSTTVDLQLCPKHKEMIETFTAPLQEKIVAVRQKLLNYIKELMEESK